jgi:hypothetical protein
MSMRESQERRAAKMRKELGLTGVVEEDEEEDVFGMGRPFVAGVARRALSAQPMQHILSRRSSSKLNTPQLLRRKSGSMVDLVTPGTSRRGDRFNFNEDDDMLSAEDESGVEDAIEQHIDEGEAHVGVHAEEEDDHAQENSDADDEYDELGQTVLHSQGNMPDDDDPESDDDNRSDGDGEEAEQIEDVPDEDETREDQALQEQNEVGQIQSQRAAADEISHAPIPSNTQRSAIADSQSESNRKRRRHAPPLSRPNSSITSFIPGSQYEGKTSQELAFMRRVHSGSHAVSSAERVPSSPPPMPVLNGEISSHDSGVIAAQTSSGDCAHQHHDESAVLQDSRTDINEIPESEYTEHETTVTRQRGTLKANSLSLQEGSHLLYATARTHASSASPSPAKHDTLKAATIISASQTSRPSQFSPRKAAGVRRFGDMAADDLMPMNNSGTTYDEMTSVMNGVLGEDHETFTAIVDSPIKKKSVRRQLAKPTPEIRSSMSDVVDAPIEENSGLPAPSESQSRLDQPKSTAEEASSPVRPTAKRRKPAPRVPSSSHSVSMEIDETVVEEPAPTENVQLATPKAGISAGINGLENIFSPSSPAAEDNQPGTTPASVRKREEAGARAVTQLLSTRSRKLPSATKKLKAIKYGHAAVGKAKGKASAAKKMKAAKSKPASVDESDDDDQGERMEVDTPHAVDPADEPLQDDAPETTGVAVDQSVQTDQDTEAVIAAPKRMFALFMGSFNNYYPATWIATSADGQNHQVKFDDFTVTTVSAKQACRLELRIGDVVRVDLPKMRKQSWTVVELVKAPSSAQSETVPTDIFGHTHVKVQAKAARLSLANAHEAHQDAAIKEVPIQYIYLTLTMWTPFQDRPFHSHDGRHPSTRMETPSTTSIHTPSGRNTPSTSRLARSRVPTIKAEEKLAHLSRDEPISFPVKSSRPNGIFSGMAFAISYVGSDSSAEKTEVMRLIELGGGKILEDGLEELFQLPSDGIDTIMAQRPSTAATTPIKPSSSTAAATESSKDPESSPPKDGLHLLPEYQNLGFVALIADHHSRRKKYIQALALDLPTLAGRWILDSWSSSSSSSSTPATPLPWPRYLLPSGECKYLHGAIRSRTLMPYLPTDLSLANFAAVVSRRKFLLKDQGVLMVAPSKKGSAGWEKRKTFIFLTLALGAARVRRVPDVKEARAILDQASAEGQGKGGGEGEWRWVYVDCALGEAGKVLFGKGFASSAGGVGAAAGGGKRKRKGKAASKDESAVAGSGSGTAGSAAGSGAVGSGAESSRLSLTDGKVMLVNDEFVIQSLILGDLVE